MRMPTILAAALVAVACQTATADDGPPVRVTVDNFRRAESDTYFAKFIAEGGFGKFSHERELAPIGTPRKPGKTRSTHSRSGRSTVRSFRTSPVFRVAAGSNNRT
jgi:hypothetical protein